MTERSEIVAALGPTNTGKTYRATQRMQEHATGMMGLPLRLLAREVYDAVVRGQGREAVALVTGEEKRVPPRPSYWICTVEAMPLDVEVDFLAVDEIQLAGHRERGHVFTDRLLRARGRKETWFLGSDTMAPLVEKLVPTAHFERYPRFSRLRGEGRHTLGSLPPRSAVVAFSMSRVYELAERIKARRGGAAVVLGALSPRARNAQVAMYQDGEVDYLVATDAIGMGLNLGVDRVSFADTSKFDGMRARELEPAELAQIAGRAGRHLSDGAFGTLAPKPPLPREIERAIEHHRFPAQRAILWRNSDLCFDSVAALVDSLRRPPPTSFLLSVQAARDTETLDELMRRPGVLSRALGRERVELLWEACQIPDYRKLLVDEHANLVEAIFRRLIEQGRLPPLWLEEKLENLTRHSGDIETITARIAACRTWNYVAGRDGWVDDPRGWQKRARQIEDSLSDALHGALVERFVARKKRVSFSGAETGHKKNPLQRLSELRAEMEAFYDSPATPDPFAADSADFELTVSGLVTAHSQPIAHLVRGPRLGEPNMRLVDTARDQASRRGADLKQLERALQGWVRESAASMGGSFDLLPSCPLGPAARGLVHQVRAGLGSVRRRDVAQQWQLLEAHERAVLAASSLRMGRRFCYLRSALKARTIVQRSALVAAFYGSALGDEKEASRVSLPLPQTWRGHSFAKEAALALGFWATGSRLVRQDVVEKMLAKLAGRPREERLSEIGTWCGCPPVEAARMDEALGLAGRRRLGRRRRGRRQKAPVSQKDTRGEEK